MELSTVMRKPGYFEPYLVSKNATHIVFTDQPAPKGVRKYDVSKAQDKGVVRWKDGDTYYFSTQRPGVKVVAPEISTYLFLGLKKLETIEASMLDVSNVTDMTGMFFSCKSLKNVDGLASWDVSNVAIMYCMFDGCRSLKNVDSLSNWDVSNVKDRDGMFYRCSNLTTVPSWFHNSNGWSNCL
jgi:surface protein